MNNTSVFESSILGEKYYRVEHKSGLRIYVFPKERTGTYAIFSTRFGGAVSKYKYGEKYFEIPLGCAHFLEHKMFDNKNRPGADDIFSSLGAYDNAYTSNDRTAYLFSCTENFEACLTELLRFVTEPYFTKRSVKKEIGIIASEIRECLDDPYDRCNMNLLDAMYYYNEVRNEICGTEESISRITPKVLYSCCKHFYTPENMILTVCGDVDVNTVISISDKVIKTPKKRKKLTLQSICEPQAVRLEYIERKMQVAKPIVSIGIKDANISPDPRERLRRVAGANILCKILFAESSDFYLKLLDEGIITPSFDAGYSSSANAAYIMIFDETADPLLLKSKILEHIQESKARGLDRSAFEREKRAASAAYVADFDSTEDIAFAMLSYADEGLDLFEYPEILNGVTFEYINELLGEMFSPEKFAVSAILPLD